MKPKTKPSEPALSTNIVMARALILEGRVEDVNEKTFAQHILLELCREDFCGLLGTLDANHFAALVGRRPQNIYRILAECPSRFAEALEIAANFHSRLGLILDMIEHYTLPMARFNEIFELVDNETLKAAVEEEVSKKLCPPAASCAKQAKVTVPVHFLIGAKD